MANSQYRDTFPRGALKGTAVLLLATLALVAYFRIAHIPPVAQVNTDTPPAATRALRFEDRPNGDVVVYDADAGGEKNALIDTLKPGTNGFLRAVMRGLAQARELDGIGAEKPFRLSRFKDGKLVLSDPATGRLIYLRAFGPTNAEAFARLLPHSAYGRDNSENAIAGRSHG